MVGEVACKSLNSAGIAGLGVAGKGKRQGGLPAKSLGSLGSRRKVGVVVERKTLFERARFVRRSPSRSTTAVSSPG
jgi:hypothetical protein